jgi:ribosome-binding protein aMBF1 (putative translation factor)
LKALRSPAAHATAAAIVQARKKAGLTQRQLAARIKRPHSVIGMIESEQRQVNVPEFMDLAEAVGEDPIELFAQAYRQSRSQTPKPSRNRSRAK